MTHFELKLITIFCDSIEPYIVIYLKKYLNLYFVSSLLTLLATFVSCIVTLSLKIFQFCFNFKDLKFDSFTSLLWNCLLVFQFLCNLLGLSLRQLPV